MTNTQFQTFMEQLDSSLREIGHEASEDIPNAMTSTILKGAIMKVRLGLRTIGNQVLAGGLTVAPPDHILCEDCNACPDCGVPHEVWCPKFPQPMAPVASSATGSGVPAQLTGTVIPTGDVVIRGCDEQPSSSLLDKQDGVGEFNPVDLYYQHQDWLARWEAVGQ